MLFRAHKEAEVKGNGLYYDKAKSTREDEREEGDPIKLVKLLSTVLLEWGILLIQTFTKSTRTIFHFQFKWGF